MAYLKVLPQNSAGDQGRLLKISDVRTKVPHQYKSRALPVSQSDRRYHLNLLPICISGCHSFAATVPAFN